MVVAVSVTWAKSPACIPTCIGGGKEKIREKTNWSGAGFTAIWLEAARAGGVYFGAVPAVGAVPGPAFGALAGAAITWGLGVETGFGTLWVS